MISQVSFDCDGETMTISTEGGAIADDAEQESPRYAAVFDCLFYKEDNEAMKKLISIYNRGTLFAFTAGHHTRQDMMIERMTINPGPYLGSAKIKVEAVQVRIVG